MRSDILYLGILLISLLITAVIVAYAWRHRNVAGAGLFAGFMTCVLVWQISYALQLLNDASWTVSFWHRFYFSTIILTPVLWVTFALTYAGLRRWLTLYTWAALGLIPSVSLILLWSNESHHLFFQELRFERVGILLLAQWKGAVWMWVHTAYSYLLIGTGMLLLLWVAMRSVRLYRAQALAILVAAIAPLVPNVLITFGWIRYPVTFVGFTVTGLVLGWAMFRYQLLDLGPVARDALIDRMADGMIALDVRNRIVDINPAMTAILGMPSAQAIGQTLETVLHRDDWGVPLRSLLDAPFSADGTLQSEIALSQDGPPRHYDLQISSLTDRRGRVTGRLIVLRDITRRKEAEDSLRRYADDLQASNAELDAFAHTVAHDLKNPLSGLIGFSTLLEDRAPHWIPEQVQKTAQRMTQIGTKMTSIVNELLLLSSVRKMDAVQTGPLDTAALVAETLQRFEEQIRESEAKIAVAGTWPEAVGYAPWVEEVWVNYVGNALKYGGVPPRIELGADILPEGQVRFWCRDNGPGLSAEARAQLFAEFTRLEQARAQGYGLGLSIVRRIIDKLGGKVGVDSVEGQGSTFWFTLPGRETSPSG